MFQVQEVPRGRVEWAHEMGEVDEFFKSLRDARWLEGSRRSRLQEVSVALESWFVAPSMSRSSNSGLAHTSRTLAILEPEVKAHVVELTSCPVDGRTTSTLVGASARDARFGWSAIRLLERLATNVRQDRVPSSSCGSSSWEPTYRQRPGRPRSSRAS